MNMGQPADSVAHISAGHADGMGYFSESTRVWWAIR